MIRDQWMVDSFAPLTVCLLSGWIIWQAWDQVHDLIVWTWRKRHRSLTKGAPAATAMRHYVEPPTPSEVAAMADDETHRITSSQWPPPYVDPPATVAGFPGPGEPRRPDRRGLIWGGLALVGTLAVFALAGGGYLAYTKLSASSTFDAHGHMLLRDVPDGIMSYTTQDNQCAGTGGYSDIGEGAPVIVKNAAGTTVAEGQLQSGVPGGAGCDFQFLVRGIPDGSKFYSFEVSHRGAITFPRSGATLPLLTLGS